MKRQHYRGKRLSRAIEIADLREMAHRRLPAFALEYLEGGAEGEVTLDRNRQVLGDIPFSRRALVDVAERDVTGSFFDKAAGLPCAIGPTGFNGLLWRHADVELAHAAKRFDIPFALSTVSSDSLAKVAREAGGRLWFQLYVWRDQTVVDALIARAEEHGCEAIVVTVDAPVLGNRTWDQRNYARPLQLTWRAKFDVLTHLRWLFGVFFPRGLPGFGNVADFLPPESRSPLDGARFAGSQMNAAMNWDDVDRIRQRWPGKFIIKGLLSVEDVERAASLGADAVVLSNHGGRQLDGDVSSMEVLPSARSAVGDRMSLFVDGGFRRGSDVAKALALGADGVLLGRATLYGVAAGGRAGAERALEIISGELDRTLALLGCTSARKLGAEHLWAEPSSE